MKTIKNKIYAFLTFVLLMFSVGAYAQVEVDSTSEFANKEDLYEVKTLDDIGLDLGKRFILATLGKDALIYFTPNSEHLEQQIRDLSKDELEQLSRPFNSQLISGILVMFSTAFLVAFVTIVVYIIWIYVETIMRTQESGSFMGEDWSKYFTPVKVIVGVMLVFPFMGKSHEPFKSLNSFEFGMNIGSFSIAQYIVLKAAGVSNREGNRMYGEYIRTTPVYYPQIKMPNPGSKVSQMEDLIDFMICAKAFNDEDQRVNMVRTDKKSSVYSLNVQTSYCKLDLEVGYDNDVIEKIKNDNIINNIYSSENHKQLQIATIQNAVQKAMNKAGVIADRIVENLELNPFINNDNTYDHEDWENGCSTIENHIDRRLSKRDLIKMYYTSAKCLSKGLVEDLSKPTKNPTYIFSENNYLEYGHLELCTHETAQASSSGRRVIQYRNFDSNMAKHKKDLNSCISELCNGGFLLECTASLNLASKLNDRERMATQGWITAGANTYSLFKTFGHGSERSIINRTSVILDRDAIIHFGFKDYNSNVNAISTIPIVMPVKKYKEDSKFNDSIFRKYEKIIFDYYEEAVSEMTKDTFNADGWFGTKKFRHCIENPQQIKDGFMCGSVTEEMHQLGSKLLALGMQLKSLSMLTKTYTTSKKDKEAKDPKISNAKGRVTKAIQYSSKLADTLIPSVMVGWFLFESGVANDSFTDFDAEVFKQYPEILAFLTGAGVMALAAGDIAFISNLLNIAVYILIPLGILFAFILPLIPLAFSMIVVFGFIFQLFTGLLMSNVWGVVLITPSKDHKSSASLESTKIIVSMLLKAPLSVAGLIIAWTLNNALISEIMIFANIGDAFAFSTSDLFRNIIDQFVILIVYFIIVYGLYNIIFSIIEGFHEITIETLFSGRGVSPFSAENRGDNWKSAMDESKKINVS